MVVRHIGTQHHTVVIRLVYGLASVHISHLNVSSATLVRAANGIRKRINYQHALCAWACATWSCVFVQFHHHVSVQMNAKCSDVCGVSPNRFAVPLTIIVRCKTTHIVVMFANVSTLCDMLGYYQIIPRGLHGKRANKFNMRPKLMQTTNKIAWLYHNSHM